MRQLLHRVGFLHFDEVLQRAGCRPGCQVATGSALHGHRFEMAERGSCQDDALGLVVRLLVVGCGSTAETVLSVLGREAFRVLSFLSDYSTLIRPPEELLH